MFGFGQVSWPDSLGEWFLFAGLIGIKVFWVGKGPGRNRDGFGNVKLKFEFFSNI